ncbi:MAG: hypothetical protein ACRD2B_13790 [Terriglobia bacterium]
MPPAPLVASVPQLIAKINSQSAAVQTLSATVDLEPSTGSVYSGVIKQYHDVKGFILAKRPGFIRMIGQAPVVRTDIFDMASNGERFSLYIPSQDKFYTGSASLPENSKNVLENLRPQHIVSALLLRPIDPATECYFPQQIEEGAVQDYVITVLLDCAAGQVNLKRRIWFDRSDLEISRLELYGSEGSLLEDVHYAAYKDFDGVHYPTSITINRPVEDYSLVVRILTAKFNQPVPVSKFNLRKPASAQLIKLSSVPKAGERHDQ